MNAGVKELLEKYSDEIRDLFAELREIIPGVSGEEIEEKLWAKLPSYYSGERFVRLIPFKDHINIEARTMTYHTEELKGYKITPKGMLQISPKQNIPSDILRSVFSETLLK